MRVNFYFSGGRAWPVDATAATHLPVVGDRVEMWIGQELFIGTVTERSFHYASGLLNTVHIHTK